MVEPGYGLRVNEENEEFDGEFAEIDFPKQPPKWCELDPAEYRALKDAIVGKLMPKQRFSSEELKKAGYSSWIQYCIEGFFRAW